MFADVAVPTFSLVLDSTQKLVKCRDQGRQCSNTTLKWASAYAARSRVPYTITVCEQRPTRTARDIALSSYLPNADDMTMLRQRLAVIVSRLVTHHVTYFKQHCSSAPQRHIIHQHSAESAVKSELVTNAFYVVIYPRDGHLIKLIVIN